MLVGEWYGNNEISEVDDDGRCYEEMRLERVMKERCSTAAATPWLQKASPRELGA